MESSSRFRFLALLALAAFAFGEADVPEFEADVLELEPDVPELENPTRIVGGSAANIANIPYQLSLRWNNRHSCGATLISPHWAVSAAPCVNGVAVSTLSLMGGSNSHASGGQIRPVAQMINHPQYNRNNWNNDINLLRVAQAFLITNLVRPATLPAQGAHVNVGTYGLVSGWGTTSEGGSIPDGLRQVWLPVVDQNRCNAALHNMITGNMFCAGYWHGGRDACQQDSGGPFAVNRQLVGVISFGFGCARANSPGVYTLVSNYRTWIGTTTGV